MAENEGTGGEGGAGGEGGVGLDISLILTPNLNDKKFSGEIEKNVKTAFEGKVNDLFSNAQEITQAFETIQKVVDSLSKNRAFRKNPASKQLSTSISGLMSRFEALGDTKATDPLGVTARTSEFSNSLARVVDNLQTAAPRLQDPRFKRQRAKLGDAINVDTLLKQVGTLSKAYSNVVQEYSATLGIGTTVADPRLQGTMVNAGKGFARSSVVSFGEQARFRNSVQNPFKSATKGLPNTRGISLDVETANWNNDIWTMAFKTEQQGLTHLQRNLAKDKITPEQFHKNYAQGLSDKAGKTAASIVSSFHDAYRATAGPGGLSASTLPPITGHNLDYDLGALRRMADQVIKTTPRNDNPRSNNFKAQQVFDTMNRLLPGGDQRQVALEGDTARRWSEFMKNELGYSAHGVLGTGKETMGNSLPAIMGGLGMKYAAHDAGADTEATDFLRRSLDSETGRQSLKKNFNYDRWLEATRSDVLRQELNNVIPKEKRHLLLSDKDTGRVGPFDGGVIPQEIYPEFKIAEETTARKVQRIDQALRNETSSTVETNTPELVKSQMIKDNEAASTALRQHLNRQVDAVTKGKDLSETAFGGIVDGIVADTETQGLINNVLKSYNIGDKTKSEAARAALTKKVSTALRAGAEPKEKSYASKEEALSAEADRILAGSTDPNIKESISADSYSELDFGTRVSPSALATRNKLLSNALNQSFQENSATPTVKQRTKTLTKADLRVSDLAMMQVDPTHPGYRSPDSVKAQYEGSVVVNDTISADAAARGNAFEAKAVQALKDKYGDRYEAIRTGEGQTTLGLGPFSGHPDGYLLDKKTGERTLLEAKYRGAEERAKIAATGKLPGNYLAQASAYALASGTPDLATTFMFGDLEDNQEMKNLQSAINHPDVKASKKAELQTQLDKLRKDTPVDQLEVGAMEMVRVAPDKGIQARILSDISNIIGKTITPQNFMKALEIPNLDQDIRKFLAAGKVTEELQGGLPKLSPAEAMSAYTKVKDEAGKLDKDDPKNMDRLAQLDVMADQYKSIMEGKAQPKDFAPEIQSSPAALNEVIKTRNQLLGLPTDKRLESTILQPGSNVATKIQQAAQLGKVKIKAQEEFAIGEGGGPKTPKPPRPPSGGGGDDGGDDGDGLESVLGPQWKPRIGLELAEQIKLVEKDLKKATVDSERARLAGAAKREYVNRIEATDRKVPDKTTILEAAVEDETRANERRKDAQGLTAQLENLRKRAILEELSQPAADASKLKADRISEAAVSLQEKRQAQARAAALGTAATIKADGLDTSNLKAGFEAAKAMSKVGLEGKEGYSRQELFRMANLKGVAFDDAQLKDLSGGSKTAAALSGLKGKDGIKELKLDAAEATKAVDGLFKQLADNSGKNFMSDEVKSIQDFIAQSQRAQELAVNLRAKATAARGVVEERSAKGLKTTTWETSAAKAEVEATAAEQQALELARKAAQGANALKDSTTTVSAYKQQYAEDAELQKEKLRDRQRQMTAQAQTPGFVKTRAYRDEESLVRRQLTSLESGKPINAQRFSARSEFQIATDEAKSKVDAFKLQIQQQAVKLNIEVTMNGMSPEALKGIIQNNLDLAKQGLKSPGLSTNDALNAALRSGTSISGAKTQGFGGYFQALQGDNTPQLLGDNSSVFNDLMAQNKLAEQTVKQLYGSLNQYREPGAGLTGDNKALFDQEQRVRSTIDKIAERKTAADILTEEAQATTDPQARADKLAQADTMRQRANNAEVAVKKQLIDLERNLLAARIDPRSATATAAMTKQVRSQLAIEKEQLIVERQRLNALVQADGGRHATAANLGKISQLNSTLGNRFNVGTDPGGLNQTQLNTVAQKRGINTTEIGGQGRSKDFVGGAIDLLDWQLQWLAGVSILNTLSGAIKNSIGFAIQYEAQMKNVELITQANTAQMSDLRTEIERLATGFQYSASEIAEGLIILGQAGFDAVQSLAILPNITALATATMSNLKIATDITTTAIEAFNVPMDKVGSLVNTLAALTIESKLDIEKLGTSFNYIASTASAAGFSIEETGAAMGLMSNAGVRASTIGTSLRSAIGSLMNPTAKFRKALADVGLSARDISPETNRLSEIFIKLKNAGFDVSSAFAGLDKRIAGGVITLVDSANEFDSFEASITGTNRAFGMAEGQMDTFSAQVKRMRNSFQLLGGSWFEGDLEPLKEAASAVTNIIKVLKAGSDVLPSFMKTSFNSVIALTTGLSLIKGVGGGIYDTVANIRRGLNFEDVQGAASKTEILGRLASARTTTDRDAARNELKDLRAQKRGSTLTGRNQKVYSTYTTLFNPAMIGAAVALTAGLMALSVGADHASGKLDVLAKTEAFDKLSSDIITIEAATKSLKGVAAGTIEYARALLQLKKVGIDSAYAPGSENYMKDVETQLRSKRADAVMTQQDLFKAQVRQMQSRQTKLSNAFNDEDEQNLQDKSNSSKILDIIKASGLFYNGTMEEIYAELQNYGVNVTDENQPLDLAMQQVTSARAAQNSRAATAAEARSFLLKSVTDLDVIEKDLERIGSKFQTMKDTSFGREDEIEAERLAVMAPREFTAYKLREGVSKFAKAYNATSLTDADRYSGRQQDAIKEMDDAFKELEEARKKLEEAQQNPDDDQRIAFTKIYSEELEQAKKAFIVASRTKAFKVGFAGFAPDQVKLADDFLSLLTVDDKTAPGGIRLDAGGIDAFKGIDISSLNDVAKKLAALNDEQLVEQSELSSMFKDDKNNLLPEIQASINIKYKLKAEEITQSAMDAAFKPLDTVFNKITKKMEEQNKLLVSSLTSQSGADLALLDSDIAERGIAGSSQATKFGRVKPPTYYDTRPTVRGYSASQQATDKLDADAAKLAIKQKVDQSVYDATAASALAQYEKDKEALGLRSFSTEQRRKEAELDLENKYHMGVLELSRKRRDQLEKDLDSITSIRAQHTSKIEQLYSVGDAAKSSAGSILDTVRAGRTGEQTESLQSIQRRAFKSYSQAKDLLANDQLPEAKQAQEEAFKELSKITSSDKYTQDEKEVAARSALRYSQGINFSIADLVSAEERALLETNTILRDIRDAIKASSSKAEPGSEIESPKYSVKPQVITRDKDGNILDVKDQPTVPGERTKTGAEGILSAEEKVKQLQDGSLTNYAELEERLKQATKTLSEINSGMVTDFIDGLKTNLPAVARQMGEDLSIGFGEAEAQRLAKEQANQLANNLNTLEPAKYEVYMEDNEWGVKLRKITKDAVTEVIKDDLTGPR